MQGEGLELLQRLGFISIARREHAALGAWFEASSPDGGRAVVALERCLISGTAQLEATLARGWLRLRGLGALDRPRSAGFAVPRVVVSTRWFSERSARRIDAFLRAADPEARVRVLITDGSNVLWPRADGRIASARAIEPTRAVRTPGSTGFSDLSFLCAKTLLLRDLPRGLRPAPRQPKVELRGGPPRSVMELANAASVSITVARRFVSSFRRLGFLRPDVGALELIDRRRLLRAFGERLASQRSVAVKAKVRRGGPEDWCRRYEDLTIRAAGATLELRTSNRFAVTGHHALRQIGARAGVPLDEVVGAPLVVYVAGAADEMAPLLDLDVVESGAWDALLLRPKFSEGTWRLVDGLGEEDRVPHVDLAHAVMDLLFEPMKGMEAAEAVERHVPALFQVAPADVS